jgi:hypothetical protein
MPPHPLPPVCPGAPWCSCLHSWPATPLPRLFGRFRSFAGKAWQTPLETYVPSVAGATAPSAAAAAAVFQLPLDGVLHGGGMAFVLRRPPGRGAEWLQAHGGGDFFVSFKPVRAGSRRDARPDG